MEQHFCPNKSFLTGLLGVTNGFRPKKIFWTEFVFFGTKKSVPKINLCCSVNVFDLLTKYTSSKASNEWTTLSDSYFNLRRLQTFSSSFLILVDKGCHFDTMASRPWLGALIWRGDIGCKKWTHVRFWLSWCVTPLVDWAICHRKWTKWLFW